MAKLVVRRLDEGVKRLLRQRADRNGCSMEEEVREILREAAIAGTPSPDLLGTRVAHRFVGLGWAEQMPAPRGQVVRPAEFVE